MKIINADRLEENINSMIREVEDLIENHAIDYNHIEKLEQRLLGMFEVLAAVKVQPAITCIDKSKNIA